MGFIKKIKSFFGFEDASEKKKTIKKIENSNLKSTITSVPEKTYVREVYPNSGIYGTYDHNTLKLVLGYRLMK